MTSRDNAKSIKIKIEKLLNEHRTGKNMAEYTHVSLGGITFPGKFNFDNSKMRAKLAKYIGQAFEKGVYFSIAEKLKEYGPIIVDVDLRLPRGDVEEGERLYGEDMLQNIATYYREAIQYYLDVSENETQCFVFEKEQSGIKDDEHSDGFHMMFPYIVASTKIRHLIFKHVYDKTAEEELFTNFSNNSKVLDDGVVATVPWQMYGCAKPNGKPYKLTKIYDNNNDEIDISTVGETYDISRLLSLRDSRWNSDNATPLSENVNEDFINAQYSETVPDNSQPIQILDDVIPDDKLDMIEKAMKLVDMLSAKRSDNYHEWLRVGWALHNTHRCLIDTWVAFSKRSKKFKEGECEKLWANMKDDGYTIRSIMLWAKEDNADEYRHFIKEDFENNLKKNSVNNTFSIAKALYTKYFDKFVCANPKDNVWYQFVDHRWHKSANGGRLITLMSSEFANQYIQMAQEFNRKALDTQGSDKKKYLDEAANFHKIADNLMDINFKERIMKEARYIFFDENFIKRLDENHHLIGFNNGVYDLKLKKFRKGLPDDHISLSTKQDYIKWSENNPYAKYINGFFEQVLPIKAVREYFLTRLSTCVSGENREEKFYFCTGSGSNGKSLTFQLVSEALGDYYISCPITIITRKRNSSNAASPELARMKGPRCGVYQEPGQDEELNVGIFKELSGNDRFMVRGLYQDAIEIRTQLKSFMTTNELPEIKSIDGGTWRRIRVIEFLSKFVENPDPDNPFEFKLDDTLKDKISTWAQAFASYLIHIYTTQYDVEGKVKEPAEVMAATNAYQRGQDVIREYYEACIEHTGDMKDGVKKRDLSANFRLWFKDDREGHGGPKAKAIYEYFEKILKLKYGNPGYMGVRFKKETAGVGEEVMDENDLDA